MRVWELLKLALEAARRTPLRVALTSLGVAIATGSLVAMVGFARGLQDQAEKPFEELDLMNRIDVSPQRSDRGEPVPGPLATPEPLDDDAVDRISKIPGVVLAYPSVILPGVMLEREGREVSVLASGLPRAAGPLPFVNERLAHGGFFSDAGEKEEILVDGDAASALGFDPVDSSIGATVRVTAPGQEPFDAMVSGVWKPLPLIFGTDRRWAVLPQEKAVSLLPSHLSFGAFLPGGPSWSRTWPSVTVRTKDPLQVPEIETAIEEMGFRARSLITQMDRLRTFFLVIHVLLAAVGTVALVVAGLGIVNTLLMAVLERTREIGTYKAIGASDGDIRLLFLAEAAVVGLLGGAGGILLGRAVAWAIGVGVQIFARTRGIDRAIELFSFPVWLTVGAIVFALAASLLSGVYPASRAARLDPIRALRGE
jgi:putative ABC transport system permease protein